MKQGCLTFFSVAATRTIASCSHLTSNLKYGCTLTTEGVNLPETKEKYC